MTRYGKAEWDIIQKSWSPCLLRLPYLSLSRFSFYYCILGSNAAIVALGGLASSLLGGILSDYLANPKVLPDGTSVKPRARAWVPAVGESVSYQKGATSVY